MLKCGSCHCATDKRKGYKAKKRLLKKYSTLLCFVRILSSCKIWRKSI